MTIVEIAKEKGVSDATARRTMKGYSAKKKPVVQTMKNGRSRKVLVGDYLKGDVKKAFAKK